MKIAKRIMLGLFGTAVLTSFILFALDVSNANRAASHSAVQTNTNLADKTGLSKKSSMYAKDETLSIGTSERHMLYQPQDTEPSQTKDSSDLTQSDPSNADHSNADQPDIVQSGQSKMISSDVTPPGPSRAASDTALSEPSKTGAADDQQRSQTTKTSENSKKTTNKHSGQADDNDRNDFQTVTEDYFSDALFIGDSRTVGMLQSHLLPQATYYAKTGIGIGDFLSKRIVNEGGWMISVKDALRSHSFGKVYIMIGINDIASGDVDWFTEQYKDILETVRRTQPEAVIYIQGNIPMSYNTQDLNGALNNKNLSLRNEASRALADAENIFYLDIDKIYADANGNLKSSYTTDGLHVGTSYYPLWVDYLLQHAIVR